MLSEEEKKAIEYLNDFKSIKIMYGNTFVMFLEQLKKYQQATNAVLNIITKQQKENKELRKGQNSLMQSRKKWKDRYYKLKAKSKKNNRFDGRKYRVTTICKYRYNRHRFNMQKITL